MKTYLELTEDQEKTVAIRLYDDEWEINASGEIINTEDGSIIESEDQIENYYEQYDAYKVLNDSEMDSDLDDYVENYVDDCMDIPSNLRPYIDFASLQADIKVDMDYDSVHNVLDSYIINDDTYYVCEK